MKFGKKNPVRGIDDNKILTEWQKKFEYNLFLFFY